MTEEKRVPIPERYKDRHTLLKAWTDAGKHPKTEYTTFMFAQEIVKYFEELGAAEAERDQLKAELAKMQEAPAEVRWINCFDVEPYAAQEAVIHACGLLDLIKYEWGECWTQHDERVRAGLSKHIAELINANSDKNPPKP